jgi:long-chain acyl-CoA synthetase
MPDDIATIIYTSGTTGEPKGVLLTHANIVSNLLDAADHHAFESDDIVLSVLPLSHVYERLAMYMFIDNGMTVYYAESFDKLGANFREVRPTVMTGVPRIFEKIFARAKDKASKAGRVSSVLFAWATIVAREYARLAVRNEKIPLLLSLKHKIADILLFKKIREAVGGRIRLFISGGAALPEELGLMLLGAGIPIVQGYGLTETSPVACAGVPENNRIATVGKPIPNVDIRVAGDGEIEVRGPNVMIGYYKNPEATRSVFTDDGWFKTGDIGMMDSEGYLRITDRKKELFKTSGGKYIAPAPIEQKIKGSRFVNQVVLIGNMRKFASALIVPDWEQLRSYAALKGINAKSKSDFIENPRILDLMQRQVDSLTQDLAQYEKVKRIALLENEFSIEDGELTPTLKVKRRIVDEKYKAVIDKLYEDAETERPLSAYSD